MHQSRTRSLPQAANGSELTPHECGLSPHYGQGVHKSVRITAIVASKGEGI